MLFWQVKEEEEDVPGEGIASSFERVFFARYVPKVIGGGGGEREVGKGKMGAPHGGVWTTAPASVSSALAQFGRACLAALVCQCARLWIFSD